VNACRGGAPLIEPCALAALVGRIGGVAGEAASSVWITRAARLEDARAGDLAPFVRPGLAFAARAALERGAALLCDETLARLVGSPPGKVWIHPRPAWGLASVLDFCAPPVAPPVIGEGTVLGPHVVLEPGVVIGARVVVGAGTVIGRPGFGWVEGPDGLLRAMPQLGGVSRPSTPARSRRPSSDAA
jgi:UDP-3-O-[3-hydroxymyristoyl] glucosamine N-acyltransferase